MVAHWVVTHGWRKKIARNKSCALVQKLIECMLPVRAGFAPNYRPGLVKNVLAIPVNGFAVALHVALLKVSGKPVKVLIVGENSL